METSDGWLSHPRWVRARDLTGLVVAWTVWLALTADLVVYIHQNSRNLPYMDDFDMVPVLTGSAPVTLDWAWSQHHEHRPFLSRLILVGLSRFVDRDFRTARYANIALLSAMAAALLVLARRLRGSARAIDAALPLSVLTLAQAETLLIGFAMNLVLTSSVAVALILCAGLARRRESRAMTWSFGLSMVVLPLCGGSGLAMLPPLALWLAGAVGWDWWSGRRPDVASRAVGAGLAVISSATVALYLRGYTQPAYHPIASSPGRIATGMLKYLSLGLHPSVPIYWWPAGLVVVMVLAATVVLLVRTAIQTPDQRPRALAMLAVILSMLSVAGAVSLSRSGLDPNATMLSRYVTLAVPIFSAIYIPWLAYGRRAPRLAIATVMLALVVSTLPRSHRFGARYARPASVAAHRVERGLKQHVPTAELADLACPALFPDPDYVRDRFQMLEAARMGLFATLRDDQATRAPDADAAIRR